MSVYWSCCRTWAILRRRIGVGPAPCVYWSLGAVCNLAMAPGTPLLHVASKSLRSRESLGWNAYGSGFRTLAILRRRIGFGLAPCVYLGLGAGCSLAVVPGAPLVHVASKSQLPGAVCVLGPGCGL